MSAPDSNMAFKLRSSLAGRNEQSENGAEIATGCDIRRRTRHPVTLPKPHSRNDKGPGVAEAFETGSTAAYFSEVEIVLKLVDSCLPTPLTAVMIAIAMPAAIRPYSMAVAPDSSFTKRETRF